MSRGPLHEVGLAEGGDYAAAFRALNKLVDEGRSWSGYERNRCFLNTGQVRFADVSATTGLDFLDDARATSYVDWDGDGDLDLFQTNRTAPQVRFLRNDWTNGNHWLALRLVGTECNRDAIGARVRLYRQGVSEIDIRSVRAGNAFLSQSSKWIHFGLSDNTNLKRVVVDWPGGKSESFSNLAADRRYRLVQGSGMAEPLGARGERPGLAASNPDANLPEEKEQGRVPLTARVPLPKLPYEDFAGQAMTCTWGEPTLVQLWASWCPMCRAEMVEFTARAEELQSHDSRIRIVSLNVDGLGEDQSTLEAAQRVVDELDFPFLIARASESLLSQLELLRAELFSNSRPFPIPTSLLIDRHGRLSTIYLGPLKVDQLILDLAELDQSDERQRELSMPFAGRWMSKPQAVRFAAIANSFRDAGFSDAARFYQRQAAPQMAISHCGLAIEAEQRGDLDLARDHYKQALKLAPQSARVQNYLGEFFLRRRNPDAAYKRFQTAISQDPDEGEFHFNLATVHTLKKRPQAARASFAAALKLNPKSAKTHAAIAKLLQNEKQWTESMTHLQVALSLDPRYAPTHVYLGIAFIQRRQLPKAEQHFAEALRLAPDMIDARAHLANVLAEQGKTLDAVEHYREILKHNPNSHGVAMKLAWCLCTCPDENVRDSVAAIDLATGVAEATRRRSPMVLDVLAAAYASAGQFEKALKIIDEATELVDANSAFQKVLSKRRELYHRRQPIRIEERPG